MILSGPTLLPHSLLCVFLQPAKDRTWKNHGSFFGWASSRCSFLLCTLLYGGMAVTGFTMFGDATASQITLNLPGQFLASKIAVWTTVGHHCSVHSLFQSLLFCHFLFYSLQFWLFILLHCNICIVGHLGPSQVVNPFTKYALTITPVAHSLEELLPQRPDSQEYRSWSLVIRTTLVLSTIAVAVLVPFFGNLSSLSLSLCLCVFYCCI